MGIGNIAFHPAGSATAPAALALTLPTPDTYRATNHGPQSLVDLPWLNAVMWGDGHAQLRHIVSNVLKTGILAPEDGPVLAPTGVKAVYDLDCDADGGANPWDSDAVPADYFVYVVSPQPAAGGSVTVSAVTAANWASWGVRSGAAAVLVGATDADTAENLNLFINQTGVEGVNYHSPKNAGTGAILKELLPDRYWSSTRSTAVVTATYKRCGTLGNQNFWSLGPAATRISVTQTATGTDGTGTEPESGIWNYAQCFYRSEDKALSGPSPNTEVEIDEGMQINLSSLEAPDDPDDDIDFMRIQRTGIEGVSLYRVADQDEDDATYSDNLGLDALLLRTLYDPDLYAMFAGGYPPRGRCLDEYKGHIYTAGVRRSADYSRGTAAVTVTDNEVVLTGGYPTTHWIGRDFQVSGDALEYPIVRVDAATNKLYLATNYQGSTDGSASYEVKDNRDQYELHNSEPGLPNAWPGNSHKGVSSPTPHGVLALSSSSGLLAIHTRTGLFSYVSEEGTLPQVHKESGSSGVGGPRCVIEDDGEFYWLGPEGIYIWTGYGKPVNIGAPPILEGEAVGIQGTLDRLNVRQLDQAVAVHDKTQRIIQWFVPLDDDTTNRYAIVLDLNARVITIDECEGITYAVEVVDPAGKRHVLAGDVYGNIFELGVGENDGAYGFEPVQVVTAADVRSVTVGGTPFPTASGGLAGGPVYMVSADGDFVRAKVASNTSSRLIFTSHLATAPAVGTQIIVGGILWDPTTGRYHAKKLRDEKGITDITLGFVPQARGQLWVASAINQGTPDLSVGADLEVDLTDETGSWVARPGQWGTLHKQRFVTIGCNFTPKLHALEFDVNYKEHE